MAHCASKEVPPFPVLAYIIYATSMTHVAASFITQCTHITH